MSPWAERLSAQRCVRVPESCCSIDSEFRAGCRSASAAKPKGGRKGHQSLVTDGWVSRQDRRPGRSQPYFSRASSAEWVRTKVFLNCGNYIGRNESIKGRDLSNKLRAKLACQISLKTVPFNVNMMKLDFLCASAGFFKFGHACSVKTQTFYAQFLLTDAKFVFNHSESLSESLRLWVFDITFPFSLMIMWSMAWPRRDSEFLILNRVLVQSTSSILVLPRSVKFKDEVHHTGDYKRAHFR